MKFMIVVLSLLAASAAQSESCIDAPYDDPDGTEEAILASLYSEISSSFVRFPSLAESIEARQPQLCLSSQMDGAHAYLDVDRNRIYVSEDLSDDMKLGVLLHEIRHLQQLEVGACPTDDLSMKEYVLASFATEADASAISLLIAWDMKEQGNEQAWTALSAWPTQSDIANRFASEMTASGNVAAAVTAAFDQWFASEIRRDLYYRAVCSDYLDRQDASKALPSYQHIPTDFFAQLCRLPDGTRYPCHVTAVKAR